MPVLPVAATLESPFPSEQLPEDQSALEGLTNIAHHCQMAVAPRLNHHISHLPLDVLVDNGGMKHGLGLTQFDHSVRARKN